MMLARVMRSRISTKQFVNVARTFCVGVEGAPEGAEIEVSEALKINSHTGRIAGQIFDCAEEYEMDHDDVLESLITINDAIKNDKLLQLYLSDTSTTKADKEETLNDLYLQLEEVDSEFCIDPLAEDTVDLLIENKEVHLLQEVVDDYHSMVLHENEEIEAIVTTADPMTEAQEDAVYARLSELADGQTVLMDTQIDESLLGGMTIKFGSAYQDLSVRSAINVAEAALRAQ